MDDAKKLKILSDIMRASHFEWRRAVLGLYPDANSVEVVKRYWEEVGKDTAQFYLKKIDPQGDLPAQFAALFVSSSVVMGEDAELMENTADGKAQARHNDCPWVHWHRKEGLLVEDQVGCDHWLKTVVDEVNSALGSSLCFETVEALPAGGECCLRRFWEEQR